MAGAGCIWFYGGGLLWQSVYGVLLLLFIEVTYFMQTSLRRARSKVIDPKTDIHISVRNLVKIYDWPGRVNRQVERVATADPSTVRFGKTTLYLPDCRMTVPFPCLTWDRKRSVVPPLIMRIYWCFCDPTSDARKRILYGTGLAVRPVRFHGVWFTWFFVGNRLWIFLLSFAVYAATLYLWRKVRRSSLWTVCRKPDGEIR